MSTSDRNYEEQKEQRLSDEKLDMNIAPESELSSEDYQHVEASVPPETLEAMKQVEEQKEQPVELPDVKGFAVMATDGKVGTVDDVVATTDVDSSYMLVKEGLIFKKEVKVPFSAVDRIEDNVVYLNVDKQYVKFMEGQEPSHAGEPIEPIQ